METAATILSVPSTWEEIECCESYMVCSMYEEAASLASAVIERVRHFLTDGLHRELEEDDHLYDMMESAGMVLVQSLRELGRTSEILNQLQKLFISSAAVPVEVFLTGICFQVTEGSAGVDGFLEEFLSNWKYMDEGYYCAAAAKGNASLPHANPILGVDKYVEVAEIYVLTILGRVLNDVGRAISWVENAALPEDKRQDILRKLHSLYSVKGTNFRKSYLSRPQDEHEVLSKEETPKILSKAIDVNGIPHGENAEKRAIIKLYGQTETSFWWFRTINMKFGNFRITISNGKILLGCLIMLSYFVLRRKKLTIKRFVTKQALSMKNAVVDFWKLAFSYQVNPLAAVQPLAAAATSAGH